jgi:hypothetical protein
VPELRGGAPPPASRARSRGVQALSGRMSYNADQLDHQQAALSFIQYLGNSDFGTARCRTGVGVPRPQLDGRAVHYGGFVEGAADPSLTSFRVVASA